MPLGVTERLRSLRRSSLKAKKGQQEEEDEEKLRSLAEAAKLAATGSSIM